MKLCLIKSLIKKKDNNIFFLLKKFNIKIIITNNKKKIIKSDKIIIYISNKISIKKSIKIIKKKKLDNVILNLKQPILGISNGLNILCSNFRKIKCLNIFKNIKIKIFKKKNIGWYKVYHNNDEKLFSNIKNNNFYQYFLNKYYIPIGAYCISHTNNIITYSSALKRKNFYGIQFNPELSGYNGFKIIKNFLFKIKNEN
ncbi:MAG: hypothetical protein NHG11_00090 [Candidatus Shikimatogenerans bostrichidophilus]|nr:MAG: hypothetical protein NHG11_00090 [Candidatus Shikimatogenerans bostrichidophilus]